jgi:hypothetical protein
LSFDEQTGNKKGIANMPKLDVILGVDGLSESRMEVIDGFPGIRRYLSGGQILAYWTQQFCSIEVYEQINMGGFPVETICCVCGNSAVEISVAWPNSMFSKIRSFVSGPQAIRLPVCDAHRDERVRCHAEPCAWRSKTPSISCHTLSFEFAVAFRQSLVKGEFCSPWALGGDAMIGWTDDDWIDVWREFWFGLTPVKRREYLSKWGGTPNWREFLASGSWGRLEDATTDVPEVLPGIESFWGKWEGPGSDRVAGN